MFCCYILLKGQFVDHHHLCWFGTTNKNNCILLSFSFSFRSFYRSTDSLWRERCIIVLPRTSSVCIYVCLLSPTLLMERFNISKKRKNVREKESRIVRKQPIAPLSCCVLFTLLLTKQKRENIKSESTIWRSRSIDCRHRCMFNYMLLRIFCTVIVDQFLAFANK
jgi:hypothetical protein